MAYQPPKEPDHTCPLIDEVLEWMDNFDLVGVELNEITIAKVEEVVDHYQANVSIMQTRMEEIRSANDALRQRSQYFEEEYDKVKSDLDDRESELEDALKELADLRQQLDEV